MYQYLEVYHWCIFIWCHTKMSVYVYICFHDLKLFTAKKTLLKQKPIFSCYFHSYSRFYCPRTSHRQVPHFLLLHIKLNGSENTGSYLLNITLSLRRSFKNKYMYFQEVKSKIRYDDCLFIAV